MKKMSQLKNRLAVGVLLIGIFASWGSTFAQSDELQPLDNVQTSYFQCPDAPFIVPSGNYISANYHYCRGPEQCTHPELGYHQGIDIKQYQNGSPVTTPGIVPVYAAYAGTVILDPNHGNAPRWLDIKHTNVGGQSVVYTFYTHLANADCSQSYIVVQNGQWVEQGQLIGYQGNCGIASGVPHLHFSVNYPSMNEYYNNQDPSPFLGFNVNGNDGALPGYITLDRCYHPPTSRNDWDRDGHPDIFAINKATGQSGKTEVHILNGADNFQSFLVNAATILHQTGSDGTWVFVLGDYNRDGRPDLYAINKATGQSGKTEVHILNGADNFQSFLVNTATILHQTGSDGTWEFNLDDRNRDGALDLYAINRATGQSGKTEVHILNGADNFQSFLLNTATTLHPTGIDCGWDFITGQCIELEPITYWVYLPLVQR